VRNVREGEELTISRINMDEHYWYRSQQLELEYCLRCHCEACVDPEASDRRRIAAKMDPRLKLPNDIDGWCADPRLPDNMYARLIYEKLRRMEEEKLEGSEVYLQTLTYSMQSCLALGQLAEAKEVQRRIIGLSHEFLTREETKTGKVELVKTLCERWDLTTFSIWRARVKLRIPSNPNPNPPPIPRAPTAGLCPRQIDQMQWLWALPPHQKETLFRHFGL
jgi:hypothetical protein